MPYEQGLPFQGLTRASTHSSWTGALSASEHRSANLDAMRRLWTEPRTINEMATLMGLPVSSICSLKAVLPLEPCGFETVTWPNSRSTKRTKWRLRP